MSFIIEKIPEDVIKKPNAEQIGFNLKLSPDWEIDYEHNAFIIINNKTGVAYDGTKVTDYFTLGWNNELIRITASPFPLTFSEQGAIMSWRIVAVNIPQPLTKKKKKIFSVW